jgi:enoyl-[acyl-carrier protein] reductase I
MNLSLAGRNVVVMGVANKRSIAWGIARSLFIRQERVLFLHMQVNALKNQCGI